MSKPFIVSHGGSLKALPSWLSDQSFSSYSIDFNSRHPMIGLHMGSGRSLTRMASLLVNNHALLDAAEDVIRNHLEWQPLDRSEA